MISIKRWYCDGYYNAVYTEYFNNASARCISIYIATSGIFRYKNRIKFPIYIRVYINNVEIYTTEFETFRLVLQDETIIFGFILPIRILLLYLYYCLQYDYNAIHCNIIYYTLYTVM